MRGGEGLFTGRGLCKCATCAYQVSAKAGTIFERCRLPLTVYFRAIWWVTSQKNGASARGLQRILGLGSYETAWTLLHKVRRAMVRPRRDRLTGIVEVDETCLGAEQRGKRGRGAEGRALVVIAAQVKDKHIGRIRLHRVADASSGSLEPAVQQAVVPGSIVRTDGWNGYNRLKALGYVHEVVRKNADAGESLLPRCKRVAALLKRWLMGTHQGALSHDHLDHCLLNIRSGSTGAHPAITANCFTGLFSRRWLLTQCDTQISASTRGDQNSKRNI